jgi:hypothetical protein
MLSLFLDQSPYPFLIVSKFFAYPYQHTISTHRMDKPNTARSLVTNYITYRFKVFPAVRVKSSIFWHTTPSSEMKVNRRSGGTLCGLLHAGFLLDLFLYPEDGGDIRDFTTLHPRRHNCTEPKSVQRVNALKFDARVVGNCTISSLHSPLKIIYIVTR